MISEQLIESVKIHEGLRLKPYKCPAGKLTIGHGRNLEANGISESEAAHLLLNDLYRCLTEAEELLGTSWTGLSIVRRDTVAEMVYQLGQDGVRKFSMMLAAIQRGMFEEAAHQMRVSAWHGQTPRRCEELAEQMATDKHYER